MVSLTESASKHIIEYLKTRGRGVGIRLAVRTTGCSGLMYVLEPVDKPESEDIEFICYNVHIYIDPKSLVYVDGTEMDYVKKGINKGFEFRNPNVQSECGCGESFSVKT
jgi:iron-sulfur cluster assembly protein|tara:strand:+ start:252 stop:578 length:327 start_codon:yes stop_codon:yes gene_type:complete